MKKGKMRQKELILVLLTAMVLVAAFFALPLSSAIEKLKLVFSQGESKEISLEALLGHNPDHVEIKGIDFLSIEDGKLLANVPITQEIGFFQGEFIIGQEKIPLLVDVNDKDSPFKVELTLKEESIKPGDNLHFYLDISVINPINRDNTAIEYEIQKIGGLSVLKKNNKQTIGFSETLVDSISIPSSLEKGKYVLIAKVDYNGDATIVSEIFEIKATSATTLTSLPLSNTIFIVLIVLIIITILFVICYVERSLNFAVKQHPERLTRIYSELIKTKRATEALRKLSHQTDLLERAHRLGFIEGKAYLNAKREIHLMAKRIKARFSV